MSASVFDMRRETSPCQDDGLGFYDHGGARFSHPAALDFSANVNPLGMPEAAVRALRDNVTLFAAYPDPTCAQLADALSAAFGTPEETVVCTAGASDAIDRIARTVRPKRAAVLAPCYSEYEHALVRVGAQVERIPLSADADFAFDDDVARALARTFARGVEVAYIASPNNPTGICVPPARVELVAQAAQRAGGVLVVDECFLGFTDAPSALEVTKRFDNVIVVGAATKLYALAGVRLGWAIAAPARARRLRAAGLPWAVSTPAQVAGVAALGDAEYVARTRAFVATERARLRCGMSALGLRVVEGRANYVLFQARPGWYEKLLDRGIVVRRCGNFEGLDDSWYRVAVRTHEENGRLLKALREVNG